MEEKRFQETRPEPESSNLHIVPKNGLETIEDPSVLSIPVYSGVVVNTEVGKLYHVTGKLLKKHTHRKKALYFERGE